MTKKLRKRLIIIFLLINVAIACFFIARSRTFQFFGLIVSEVKTNDKIVALTFDDGPAQNTQAILNILRERNVKASFFLTGEEIAVHQDLTKEIINEGHCVGNHSWSHSRMIFKSISFIKSEVERTDSIIKAMGYNRHIFFRPPYCKKFIYLPWYLKQTGRTTVTWNIEPDSEYKDPALILKNVQDNIKPGAIILLHAMYDNRAASLSALPYIIEWLQQRGYKFATLDELTPKS